MDARPPSCRGRREGLARQQLLGIGHGDTGFKAYRLPIPPTSRAPAAAGRSRRADARRLGLEARSRARHVRIRAARRHGRSGDDKIGLGFRLQAPGYSVLFAKPEPARPEPIQRAPHSGSVRAPARPAADAALRIAAAFRPSSARSIRRVLAAAARAHRRPHHGAAGDPRRSRAGARRRDRPRRGELERLARRTIPNVDRVETLDAAWLARDGQGLGRPPCCARARAWRSRAYDLAINFEPDIRSNLIVAAAGAVHTAGWRSGGGSPLLDLRSSTTPDGAHERERAAAGRGDLREEAPRIGASVCSPFRTPRRPARRRDSPDGRRGTRDRRPRQWRPCRQAVGAVTIRGGGCGAWPIRAAQSSSPTGAPGDRALVDDLRTSLAPRPHDRRPSGGDLARGGRHAGTARSARHRRYRADAPGVGPRHSSGRRLRSVRSRPIRHAGAAIGRSGRSSLQPVQPDPASAEPLQRSYARLSHGGGSRRSTTLPPRCSTGRPAPATRRPFMTDAILVCDSGRARREVRSTTISMPRRRNAPPRALVWIKQPPARPGRRTAAARRFTSRGDSLWWFAELYLHKQQVIAQAFRVIAALDALLRARSRGRCTGSAARA